MKAKRIILKLIFLLLIQAIPLVGHAQEAGTQPASPVAEAVKATFENPVQINNQTVENPGRKSLDFIIQHRFGLIENSDDLFGLYAPSNIRLGLNYGITKKLAVGIGATKNKRLYDVQWKYILFNQMKDGGMPVTIAYYGDIARSSREEEDFLNEDTVYKAANRISYFHELMIARKVNSKLSLQVAAYYAHFNMIEGQFDSTGTKLLKGMKHDNIGATFVGRYKFSPQSSIILDFDYPITKPDFNEPKPNLGLGLEVSTGSHQFQIFLCTSDAIINQESKVYNLNDFTKRDVMLGFNITRQWGF